MKTTIISIGICILLGIYSCSEKKYYDIEPEEEQITLQNNMLVFPSQEVLNKVLMNKQELPAVPFLSQKVLFDQIIDAEYKHASSMQNISKKQSEKSTRHSTLYEQALKESFIKETLYQDSSILYDLNVANPSYAKILNKDGFYAIKDTIYQLTSHQLKAWKNCKNLNDTNKLQPEILNEYSLKNITRGLFPLKSVDQAVAYYNTSGLNYVNRAIVSLYDRTSLAIPNVNRELFVRVSFQRKVNGNYIYMSFPYSMEFGACIQTEPNGEQKRMILYANGTGGNDWYTVYLEYEFLSNGKTIQTYTTDYFYLVDFSLVANFKVLDTGEDVGCGLNGKRLTSLEGFYTYFSNYGSVPLTPLLPEN